MFNLLKLQALKAVLLLGDNRCFYNIHVVRAFDNLQINLH